MPGGGVQVFLFCANEKGASWAYATPGFGASLAPAHLKMLRQMANPELDEANKVLTLAFTSKQAHLFFRPPSILHICIRPFCQSHGSTLPCLKMQDAH
jgi:hypothetical protein